MKRFIAIAPLLVACSGDTFTWRFEGGVSFEGGFDTDTGADAGSTDDAASDVRIDGEDAGADSPKETGCPYDGGSECQKALDTYCAKYEGCCTQSPGNGYCSSWGSDAGACKAYWKTNGIDCASGKYNKPICASSSSCAQSYTSTGCTLVFQSAGPASNNFACGNFWGQF